MLVTLCLTPAGQSQRHSWAYFIRSMCSSAARQVKRASPRARVIKAPMHHQAWPLSTAPAPSTVCSMSLKSRRYLCPPGPAIRAASVSSMNSGQEFFVQSPLQCCLQSHYVPSPSLLSMGKEPSATTPSVTFLLRPDMASCTQPAAQQWRLRACAQNSGHQRRLLSWF